MNNDSLWFFFIVVHFGFILGPLDLIALTNGTNLH